MKTVENNNQSEDEKNEGFWKEGKYVDAWSIVHFISGLLLGFILNALGFSIFEGFFIAALLVILWEIIEPYIWPGWHETWQNQICDIIIGLIGYLVAKLIDALIVFLFTGEMFLDFSLKMPEPSSLIKLLLMFVAFIIIMAAGKKQVVKQFKEKDAKKELNDFLEELKKKIDESDLPGEQKEELKKKIDKAKELIATCESEDLDKADEILKGIVEKLEKEEEEEEDEAKKTRIKDIINDLGIARTFIKLIEIKKNWKRLGGRAGVRDVIVRGNDKCYIVVQYRTKPWGKWKEEKIEIKKEKCEEATEFIKKLKEKVEACNYPNLEDAKKIWEFIDP